MPVADPGRARDASPDAELRAERAHLAASRDALRRMREDVLSTETSLGDAVADKVTNEVLRQARAARAEALVDLPDVPLFFGRMDYPPGAVYEAVPGEAPTATRTPDADRVYVGRRHVHDRDGDPMVLDWRAPVSTAFYRATPDTPMGARLRRRYGFSPTAELTAFEDEPLTREASGAGGGSLLAEEIERPRSGPMRDIVATIQPEQDDLVRAPLERSLCVQGAPGTGKTAVGLHRVAYLLYAERERLERRGGVAIVGPNRSFLSYIRNVLPALGEVDVRQTTVADLLGAVPVRRAEPSEAALVKGDARMAEVIRRDLWSRLREPVEPLLVRQGSRRWRLYPDEMAEIVAELRGRGVSYGAGRELLAHRLAHAVLVLMEGAGQVCDDRTHDRVRRDRAVRAAVQQMWPRVEPVRQVLELLTDPDRMAEAADGLLTPDEQAAVMLPGRPRGPGSARWSLSDLALIDETAGLVERPASLGHVVVDEAQDLTPMQCRAIGRRVAGGSVTVLGDLAQGTVPGAVEDWETLLTHLGTPDARLSELVRGYRVPAQIIDFAARLLPRTAPGLARPVAFRQAPGSLTLLPTERADLTGTVLRACRTELAREGSVGLIAADAAVADLHRAAVGDGLPAALLGETEEAMAAARLVCVPASLAKGLEFDAVVVVEPAAVVAAEPRGLHRLYVVLTRAVSRMTVVHAEPLPEPLTG